ncbi:MAG: thioredoxin family protein [Armatimonadota bacterium]
MKVQILGMGCPKCKQLAANAEQALKELGLDGHVEKVEDIREIAKFNVMMTPALAIDGQVKASGKVLSIEEIKKLLQPMDG